MSVPLSFRVTLGVMVIFLAGTVSGAFLGARLQLERQSKETDIRHLPESVMAMLDQRLGLSGEQSKALEPLVDQACKELEAVHDRNFAEVGKILYKYYGLMAPKLSTEQAETLENMETELRDRADELKD